MIIYTNAFILLEILRIQSIIILLYYYIIILLLFLTKGFTSVLKNR